jgi:hypothetical protein
VHAKRYFSQIICLEWKKLKVIILKAAEKIFKEKRTNTRQA